ncbi:alpha/beta hydrolase [soil metagenome]
MRRMLRWLAIGVAVLVLLVVVGGIIWTRLGPDPTPDAEDVAADADNRQDGWLAFGSASADTGIVLYPGARIDATAYAPVAQALAQQAMALVVVLDAPLDIALLDVDGADPVRDAHPEVDRWIVGGHSLGGVAAARYAGNPDAQIDGLLLWASYPAGGDQIPAQMAVTSIAGARDRVLDRDAFDAARGQLPDDAVIVGLAGVNHAQFGDYGTQAGDGPAAISNDEARAQIVEASSALVSRVMSGTGR